VDAPKPPSIKVMERELDQLAQAALETGHRRLQSIAD
jgi:hypothetical protein